MHSAPLASILASLVFLTACDKPAASQPSNPPEKAKVKEQLPPDSFAAARKAFATKLTKTTRTNEPLAAPPAGQLELVRYPSPAGKLAAYVSTRPADGKKHPAIVWIEGGFGNGVSATSFTAGPSKNDQSAIAFRQAGVVTMYPSFRGGNDNPGNIEMFYGEVDDVLAAADYLSKLDYVDPKRIYLGGHSTGGTMALLASELSPRFRAVFSFGPISSMSEYAGNIEVFDTKNPDEMKLRSPGEWMESIRSQTFIFEGVGGNISSLKALHDKPRSSVVAIIPVKNADHFNLLAPLTMLIAGKIMEDTALSTNIEFTPDEIQAAIRAGIGR